MSRVIKKGVELLDEVTGQGNEVERQKTYQIELQCWLNRGDKIRWSAPWGLVDRAELLDNNTVLRTDVRIDREQLIAGLFYGVNGMRVGGWRRLQIAPHLAYGESGVPGEVPENALLVCEIRIVEERCF